MEEARDSLAIFKPLEELFGLEGRVLRVLVANLDREFTKKELQKEAGVSQTFLNRFYKILKDQEFITITKKVGKVEFFKSNLNNEILEMFKMWYLTKLKEKELEEDRKIYEKYYKGKETKEDKALVRLLEHYEQHGNLGDIELPADVLQNLEKQGMIITKGSTIYFTDRGYGIAKALVEFDEKVLGKAKALSRQ